ncbi:MAG: hypothetical protein H6R16_435 [Proteobacteria bacterium]|nr:hypothetical protein [Pseudomonadota bacterium]
MKPTKRNLAIIAGVIAIGAASVGIAKYDDYRAKAHMQRLIECDAMKHDIQRHVYALAGYPDDTVAKLIESNLQDGSMKPAAGEIVKEIMPFRSSWEGIQDSRERDTAVWSMASMVCKRK